MYYTEWLRARGALKWTAYVLGALLVTGVALYIFKVPIVVSSAAHTQETMTYGHLVSSAIVVGLVVATVLGAPFAKENDGHLEIALTKPIERTRLSVQIMLVDAGAIAGAFVLGYVVSAVLHLLFLPRPAAFEASDAMAIALSLAGTIAWYAMLNALTASMKRGFGVVLGMSWPVALGVSGGAHLPPGEPIRDAIRTLCGALDYLNPLHYIFSDSTAMSQLVTLLVLALVYATAAAIQWRRVEA